MVCPKCGTPKLDCANFCWNCGYNFSQDLIEDYRDSYQINIGSATIIGLCSGIVTGIFSAAISQVIKFEWWGWAIVLVFSFLACGVLIFKSFSAMKESITRQLRRRQ